MKYQVVKLLDKTLKGELDDWLRRNSPLPYAGEDEVLSTITVKFENDFEADIKVVNGSDGCGPWGEVILFDNNGNEVDFTEPFLEKIAGTFSFEVDSDTYTVTLK